jgi:hypothetical protein
MDDGSGAWQLLQQRIGIQVEQLGIVAHEPTHEHRTGKGAVVVAFEGLHLAHREFELTCDVAKA